MSAYLTLSVSHLHKKARNKRFSNINIIVATSEVSTRSLQTKSIHDPRELSAYIVSALQRTVVDEIVVTPSRIFMV